MAKDVLYALDVLIAMRTVGTLDRKAMLDMFQEVIETDDLPKVEEFRQTIPKLEDGTAWIWSPQYLKCFDQVAIRTRTTFHGGATAQAADVQLVQAKPDVSALRRRLEPPPEKPEQRAHTNKNVKEEECPVCHPELDPNFEVIDATELAVLRDKVTEVDAFQEHNERLSKELAELREAANAMQQIRQLLSLPNQSLQLGTDDLWHPLEGNIDEDSIVEKVLARIPANGAAPIQVTPPEALRKRHLQAAADRLYGKIEKLDSDARQAMEYLLGQGTEEVSIARVSQALSGHAAGATHNRWSKALAQLATVGVAATRRTAKSILYRAQVEEGVRSELTEHNPTDHEIAQVVQHVLARVAI